MTNFYGWLVAFGAAMAGFLFGYEIGIIDQVLHMDDFAVRFGLETYNATSNEYVNTPAQPDIVGWITFTFLICAAGGAILVSWMADAIGRRLSLGVGGVIFAVGGALQCGAENIGELYAGRAVAGFAIGILSMVAPLYIGETADQEIRGKLLVVQQLMVTIGIFIATCINSLLLTYSSGQQQWRTALGLQIIPAGVLVGLMFVLPYSPRWLMYKGRDEEARAVLGRLRQVPIDDAVVTEEFDEIKASLAEEARHGSGEWKELAAPGIRNRVGITVGLQMFQQWTGINVILYYAATIFQNMGFSKSTSSIALPLVNNAINWVATYPGMYLVEKIGRRPLLLWGAAAMCIAQFMVQGFLGGVSVSGNQEVAWGAVIGIYIFVISFAMSWGPVPWAYQSEVFPMRVRAKGTGMATLSNWVWNAIVAKISPIALSTIGSQTYAIFACFCFVMIFFVYFLVPETAGKTVEEMDLVFNPNSEEAKLAHQLEDKRRHSRELRDLQLAKSRSGGGASQAGEMAVRTPVADAAAAGPAAAASSDSAAAPGAPHGKGDMTPVAV